MMHNSRHQELCECKYYDQGWNDYVLGYDRRERSTRDYRDGWADAQEADSNGHKMECV